MLSEFTFSSRARPIVEIGLGDFAHGGGNDQWDVAHWDEAGVEWNGIEPTWRDVACDTVSADFGYGRDATIGRFLAGTAAVIVDNASGWADPKHGIVIGTLAMRPGRQIRIGIDHKTLGTKWLWRGFLDSIVPLYDPVQADQVELVCTDALGEVGRAKLQGLHDAGFAGDTADARINRLLNLINWWGPKRDIWATSDRLIASTLGGQMADLLGQAADSVGGSVFSDTENNICFRPADWLKYDESPPPHGTIGNVDPSDVCPSRWERPFDRADISTRVLLGRDETTAHVHNDPQGQALYGIEPFERFDLLTQDDFQLDALADLISKVRDESTAPRVRSVLLSAATADNALDMMTLTNCFTPNRYRCRLRLPRGDVFDAQHYLTGVRHVITRDSWESTLALDLSEPYEHKMYDRWDTGNWGVSHWRDPLPPIVGDPAMLLAEAEALLEGMRS